MLTLNITTTFRPNFHQHFAEYLSEMKYAGGSKDSYGIIILRSVVWTAQP
jgi:hypothetical protein